MPLWVAISLASAFMQNLRTALQKALTPRIGVLGATYARFLFAAPWAVALVAVLAAREGMPQPTVAFALWGLSGAVAQIVATLMLLHLFSLRNFAVGNTFAKTETVQAVLFGLLWPARRISSQPDEGEPRLLLVWRRVEARVALAAVAMAVQAGCLLFAAHGEIGRDVEVVREANVPGANIEPLVREAIARHPGEPWFQFIAGLDRIRHRQPKAALHYLNRALLLDPTSWRPHLATAEALFQMNRVDQAVLELRLAYLGSAFDDVVAVASLSHKEFTGPEAGRIIDAFGGGNPAVLAAYANYLDRTSRDDLTSLVAGQLLGIRPDDEGAHRLMARADVRRKRFESALVHARKLAPGDPEGLLLQVQSLDGLGRGAESDKLLEGIDRSQREGAGARLAPDTVMLLAERALTHGNSTAALAAHQVVIVCGETGSGKTTQIPKMCLVAGRGWRHSLLPRPLPPERRWMYHRVGG